MVREVLWEKIESFDNPGFTDTDLNHVLNLLACINIISMTVDSVSAIEAISNH